MNFLTELRIFSEEMLTRILYEYYNDSFKMHTSDICTTTNPRKALNVQQSDSYVCCMEYGEQSNQIIIRDIKTGEYNYLKITRETYYKLFKDVLFVSIGNVLRLYQLSDMSIIYMTTNFTLICAHACDEFVVVGSSENYIIIYKRVTKKLYIFSSANTRLMRIYNGNLYMIEPRGNIHVYNSDGVLSNTIIINKKIKDCVKNLHVYKNRVLVHGVKHLHSSKFESAKHESGMLHMYDFNGKLIFKIIDEFDHVIANEDFIIYYNNKHITITTWCNESMIKLHLPNIQEIGFRRNKIIIEHLVDDNLKYSCCDFMCRKLTKLTHGPSATHISTIDNRLCIELDNATFKCVKLHGNLSISLLSVILSSIADENFM